MPELAEVEIVRRNLERWWTRPASDLILDDPELLRDGTPEGLRKAFLTATPELRRRGKYLLFDFGEHTVVAHFRMSGKIVLEPQPSGRFARLSWAVDDGWLVFKDPRRLGHVELYPSADLPDAYPALAKMGPEPLDLPGPELAARLSPRRRLKDALLDQKVVAGVGNIAISEIFWRLSLPPDVKVAALADDDVAALAAELGRYFRQLIEVQSGDEVVYLGEGAHADNPFDVYDREGSPCSRCGTRIDRETIGGRSSYFCPRCQS